MPRALLAWEGGAGRGHIVNLRTVAETIGDRFSFDAALCNVSYKSELAHLCHTIVKGPWLPYSGGHRKARGNPPTATWGEFMGDIGFRRPDILSTSIGWWQKVMRERDISLLIADSAPCALMAARGLGVTSIAIGSGYLLPDPSIETFPVLLPQYSTRIHDEAEIVEVINSVLPEFAVPPIKQLAEVYTSTEPLVFTLDLLDPYFEWRKHALLPPVMGGSVSPTPGGDEVFVYFSTTEKSEPELIEAIGSLGVPTRLFMPPIEDEMAMMLTARGVIVERAPVPVQKIVEHSRLIVNAGQHGILCTALAGGLPQVCVPQHLEHHYHALAASRGGSIVIAEREDRTADRFRSKVLDAYESTAMSDSARHLEQNLRPQFQVDTHRNVRRRIMAAIDR